MRHDLPTLVTLAALLVYVVTAINVGRARARYKVDAPAVSGHPDFERVYRVQMNTLEQIVAFLPALWLFALYQNPAWAAALGAVWIFGRILYAAGYYRAAERRGAGFVVTFTAFALLWCGALWGVGSSLLRA